MEMISSERIKIPGRIGNSNILIEANIVDCELPLLMSKPALKKGGAILDFLNDKMIFNGESVELFETKSGHYCVPICNKRCLISETEDTKKPNLVLTVTNETLLGKDTKEIRRKAKKLHSQFSHAPGYKLKDLLKKAGFEKEEYFKAIDEVSGSCEICIRYKKPKPKPVVGLPRGQTFNDTVAMDLKTLSNNVHILYMIDTVTRYSAAKIIYNKRKETIVDGLCCGWISIFGNPKRFMADNGGDFVNSEFIELCEKFNIDVQNSAAESPFGNGMVERHHRMLVEMLTKTKEDVHCSWEVALSWALSAKNSMQMFGGFSAFQLTMGRNPTLPNIIDNKLPALEESTVGKTVSENIAAMISSREAFVKCESSNKIKRALRSQVRTCNDDYFDIGEKVFYKRKDSEKWHGPGVVLGRESQSIVVKHGNQYIKVHPCHTTKYPKECNDGNKNSSLSVLSRRVS